MNLNFPYCQKKVSEHGPDESPYPGLLNKYPLKDRLLTSFYKVVDPLFAETNDNNGSSHSINSYKRVQELTSMEWDLHQRASTLLVRDLMVVSWKCLPFFIKDIITDIYKRLMIFILIDDFLLDEDNIDIAEQDISGLLLRGKYYKLDEDTIENSRKILFRIIRYGTAAREMLLRSFTRDNSFPMLFLLTPLHIILPKKISGLFTRYLIRGPAWHKNIFHLT